MAKFLKAQQEKWQCSKCGEVICCHNGLCFNCDFQKLKKKKIKSGGREIKSCLEE